MSNSDDQARLPVRMEQDAVRFDGLDILRTLLALWVALGHFFLWNGVTNRIPQTSFIAVDFFFALSGFVLTQSIFKDKSHSAGAFIRHFLTRRLFRLYPLYLLVFILWLPLLQLHAGARDPLFEYFISLIMVHSMGFADPNAHIFADTSIGIGWSISVEFWAGLPFFIGVYALRRHTLPLIASCGFILFFGLLIMINFSSNYMNVNLQKFAGIATFGEIRGCIGFAAGCLCYLLYARTGGLIRPRLWLFTGLEIATLALSLALYGHIGDYARSNDFVAPFLAFAAILLIALRRGLLSRLLYLKALAPLRPLSYSIYLVHPFYVFAFRHFGIGFNSGVHALVYVGLIVASAILLYKGVEEKFILFGKRLGKAPRETPVPALG